MNLVVKTLGTINNAHWNSLVFFQWFNIGLFFFTYLSKI